MTTREAARPLRRYMRARVRAASLAPTYTITRDVTMAPDRYLCKLPTIRILLRMHCMVSSA